MTSSSSTATIQVILQHSQEEFLMAAGKFIVTSFVTILLITLLSYQAKAIQVKPTITPPSPTFKKSSSLKSDNTTKGGALWNVTGYGVYGGFFREFTKVGDFIVDVAGTRFGYFYNDRITIGFSASTTVGELPNKDSSNIFSAWANPDTSYTQLGAANALPTLPFTYSYIGAELAYLWENNFWATFSAYGKFGIGVLGIGPSDDTFESDAHCFLEVGVRAVFKITNTMHVDLGIGYRQDLMPNMKYRADGYKDLSSPIISNAFYVFHF
jgi:hypothetical protein